MVFLDSGNIFHDFVGKNDGWYDNWDGNMDYGLRDEITEDYWY